MFIIEQRFGNDGYAFWFKLLECLGNAEGHYLTLDNPVDWEFLQAKTKLGEGFLRQILDLLSILGAIDSKLWSENQVVWSDHFVEGVSEVYRNRKLETPTKPSFLQKKPRNAQVSSVRNPENQDNSEVSTVRNPQSKVKESKVNNTSSGENTDESAKPTPDSKERLQPTEEEEAILEFQQTIPGWPFEAKRDLGFIRELAEDYPGIDILQTLKDLKTWQADKKGKRKIANFRLTLRNFVKGNAEKGRNLKPKQQPSPEPQPRVYTCFDQMFYDEHGYYPGEEPSK
jgi:DNA mismatch repair ATPase MutL